MTHQAMRQLSWPHRALWIGILLGWAGLVVLAVVIVAAGAPPLLRFACAPVLVAVPAVALMRTVLSGNADAAVRAPLAGLLGVVLTLLVVIGLDIAGVRVTPVNIAVAFAGPALLGGAAALWGLHRGGGVRGLVGAAVARRHTWAAVIGAVVLLTGAIGVGVSLQVRTPERYTSLNLVDSAPFQAQPYAARPSQMLRINWMMRGFGYTFTPKLTSVELRLDGVPVEDVAVDLDPVRDADLPDGTGTLAGAVTFPCPREPGLHRVELTVRPAAEDGAELPQPGFLTSDVEVRR
jgi:hypothetical protein